MWDFEFMKHTVIMCTFMMIIMADIVGFSYWTIKFVRWIRKKVHKVEDAAPAADNE